HPARLDDVPLRPRARRALVPCGADGRRLHLDRGLRSRPLLAGRDGPVDCDRARTVRALSLGSRAAAARTDSQYGARSRPRPRRRARQPPSDRRGRGGLMRRLARVTGTLMIVTGVLAVAWVVLVWQWQDPFTALYTKYEQHKLASKFAHRFADYRPPAPVLPVTTLPDGTVSVDAERKRIATAAAAYRRSLPEGDPVGRLIVPRFGLKSIVVNGTSHDDLTRGPGRELHTYMPGQNGLIYIAGHRTTYLAPFAHIDSLRPGDPITFVVPYGTFHYEVTGHR